MTTKLREIQLEIQKTAAAFGRKKESIALLAVTKNQSLTKIITLLEQGHRLFGENKVQEAYSKWPQLKTCYEHITLHLIGHLQTNKIKEAIALFDVIQTLDSLKLAEKLAREENLQNKQLKYYIEINVGHESQKSGISTENFSDFYFTLRKNYPLCIEGVMCIPPRGENPAPYFQKLSAIAADYQLPVVSMGMSEDYKLAIQYHATMIRIGRALFE